MSRILWFIIGSVATAATAIGAAVVSTMMDGNSEGGSSEEAEGDQEDAPLDSEESEQSEENE